MCSIMCYIKGDKSKSAFVDGFMKSKMRGPDDTIIIPIKNDLMGFHRLAIMDLENTGMQPFEYDGSYVVCNGEVYGFSKIKEEMITKGYNFKGNSDCEILLPMYFEYGTEMFKMLDAEYALVIYDKKKDTYIAARDPIGIRPLFYGYDKDGNIIFASEAICLVDLCKTVKPFPPGHYYIDGKFVEYNSIYLPKKKCDDGIEEVCKNIKVKLVEGVKKRLVSDAKIGFLLSGGLDSSLVCSIAAKELNKKIKTFAIGMDIDAIDLKYAKEVANYIGSEHTEVIISRDDVINNLEKVISILGTYDITTIRASVGMYLVCKYIHENTDIRVLLTGEISDELFGYKYTDFAPNATEFQKEAEKRIKELYMYDVLRADRCISDNSLEARVPFGDIDFVEYVMSINPELKINTYGKGKYLLRHAFEGDYLPDSILWREKAAFSDAVGHSMVNDIKEYAESYYTDEDFEMKKEKYKFAKPWTKESLLYREIFEKYYGDNANMIVDFWMPNKNWEGCNVDDPSARVLSNYGESGK